MRMLKWLCLLYCCYLPFALAADLTETVTVSGQGKTQAIAIANALAQAVQQINGVQVEVKTQVVEKQSQVVMNWLGQAMVLPGGEFNQGYVNTQSQGPISAYTLSRSEYLKDQQLWQVTLAVKVLHYQALQPQRDHLTTLAIAPFSSDKSTLSTLSGTESAKQVAKNLQQQISHSIVQTGRFRVLDRNFWPQLAQEDFVIQNYSQATKQYIKQGQRLGADLLVVGNIQRFDISKQPQQVYDSQQMLYQANFQVDVEVIETATAEVLYSQRIQLKLSHQQLQQWLQEKISPLQGQYRQQAEDEMDQTLNQWLAERVAAAVVWRFYPVRVLDKQSDTIYLSQGDGLLQSGDDVMIYAAAKDLKDSDTGMTIAATGDVVARAQVMDVENYYAKAKLIEGDSSKITVNAIAKKQFPVLWQVKQAPVKALSPGSSEKPLTWP